MCIADKFHCNVSPISCGQGKSAVAAAAYRAGVALFDERIGQTWDYSRKKGILSTAIILPSGLSAAGEELTRKRLWNMAEAAETRSNARVAKDYEITLPEILSEEQRHALGLRLGQWIADHRQSIVDVAFHDRRHDVEAKNFHVHILCTTREVSQARGGGLTLGAKCAQELSDSDRRKLGLGAAGEDIKKSRIAICDIINEALEGVGCHERMNALSYAERGINRIPTVHLGPVDAALERSGIRTERGDLNREIQARNRAAEKAEREMAEIKAELAADLLAPYLAELDRRNPPPTWEEYIEGGRRIFGRDWPDVPATASIVPPGLVRVVEPLAPAKPNPPATKPDPQPESDPDTCWRPSGMR